MAKIAKKNSLLDLIKEKSDESTAHAKINAEEKLASPNPLPASNELVTTHINPDSSNKTDNGVDFDDIESQVTLGVQSRVSVRNASPVLLPVKGPKDGEQEQVPVYSFKSKRTFEFDAHLMQVVENIIRHQPGRSLVDFVETAVRAYARKLERENGGPFLVLKDYHKYKELDIEI